jgi:hypothetical protein
MKKIYKYLLMTVVASSTMFYSCDTLEMEDLASPNALSPDLASADLLLNTIQLSYLGAMQDMQYNGAALGRISNMFGRNYYNNFNDGTVSGAWSALYAGMIPDIAVIEGLNTDGLLDFHMGISKVMQAHVIMGLVDSLGDIPWSQAGNPSDYPSPAVDSGEDVYAAAVAMLGEAAGYLSSAGGGDDLFYGGDISKWVKLHNTLLMRANLTLCNASNLSACAAVLAQTNVISSEADDFQFNYGDQELLPDTRHPNYQSDYTTSGANIYQSNWLMDQMIGGAQQWADLSELVAADTPDPITDTRRRFYFYRQTWDTPGNIALVDYISTNPAFDGNIYVWPGDFNADNTNGETLQCSLQLTPNHLLFTPDEDLWCSTALGYWGRAHGNDEGTPPDNFTRTASGVYPGGGSFDNQYDRPSYVGGSGLSNIPTGAVNQGQGGGGAGIWPIYLSSYVSFMKAEAAMWTGDVAMAATYMEQGMNQSIAKVQGFVALDADADADLIPSAADNAAFVASVMAEFNAADVSTSVDSFGYPEAKDKMDILGEQYFVAMYGGANDAWNFIRRTGYPRTIGRSVADATETGIFPRTGTYPGSEISANPNIVQRGDNSTRAFWDTATGSGINFDY